MSLYSDREFGAKPRTETIITRRIEDAIAQFVRGKLTDSGLGYGFPYACPDNGQPCGVDDTAFWIALGGMVPEVGAWKSRVRPQTNSEVEGTATPLVLDALEWISGRIGKAIDLDWHSFFRHHHLEWDRDEGLKTYVAGINEILARNGLAYEMTPSGQIIRLIAGPEAEILKTSVFQTGDVDTDRLLTEARNSFFDRSPGAAQRSLEKIWDAFERVKSLDRPDNKKESAKALIAGACESVPEQEVVNAEMIALTAIGNSWQIRHHEVGKFPFGSDRRFRDYLILRMFALIRHLLLASGRMA